MQPHCVPHFLPHVCEQVAGQRAIIFNQLPACPDPGAVQLTAQDRGQSVNAQARYALVGSAFRIIDESCLLVEDVLHVLDCSTAQRCRVPQQAVELESTRHGGGGHHSLCCAPAAGRPTTRIALWLHQSIQAQ